MDYQCFADLGLGLDQDFFGGTSYMDPVTLFFPQESHPQPQENTNTITSKEFSCDFTGCKRSFIHRYNLQNHQQNCKWNPYKDICLDEFLNQDMYVNVPRLISSDRPFHCLEINCGKSFKTRQHLHQHYKFVHSNERPFSCDFPDCKASFKTKPNLCAHQLLVHSKERPFSCDFPGCTSAFVTSKCLRRHKLIHSEEKPFSCDFPGCTVSFKTKQTLYQHKKFVHFKEKLFSCELGCNKQFNRQGNLQQHQKICKGAKI